MPGYHDVKAKLSHADLVATFEDLSNRLAERGVRAHMYIIGGAAMVFSHRRSRTTVDVDALIISPRKVVLEVAAEVARDRNLGAGWLNDDWRWVPSGLPRLQPDTTAEVVFETPHLVVTGASPRHMLALKMRTIARGSQADAENIETLVRKLDVKSVDEDQEILQSVFPGDEVDPRMAKLLKEMLHKKDRGAVRRGSRTRNEE